MAIVCLQSLPELSALHCTEPDTELFLLGSDKEEGRGTLFVDESRVVWWCEETQKGYSFDYNAVVCHAVCRDQSAWPKPCIYCHLDVADEADDDTDVTLSEIRLVPAVETALDRIFEAMSDCQALHPDDNLSQEAPSDMFSLDDDTLYTAENIDELEEQLANDQQTREGLRHLEDVFVMPSQEEFDAMMASKDNQLANENELFKDAD